MVFEKANPSNRKTVAEVTELPWDTHPAMAHPAAPAFVSDLPSNGKPDRTAYLMCRQANFIEVEVDPESGQVEVTNAVCVNDVGHLFNPQGAMAQQYGGAVMGLGRSATEEKVVSATIIGPFSELYFGPP
jgi:CO/xanthine dehydrogenase Mo-binding subunit